MATSEPAPLPPKKSVGEPAPLPPKKSVGERLNDIMDQIESLEEKRKELLFEEAKQEAREDEAFLEEIHKECISEGDLQDRVEEAREEAEGLRNEAWDYLEVFGGHTATCLSGALAATQALHPLCTCGWNHVATELEKT